MTALRRKLGAVVLAVGVLGGTAACGGGGSDSDAGGSGGDAAAEAPADAMAAQRDGVAADEEGSGESVFSTGDSSGGNEATPAPRVPVQTRAVISTGRVTLEAEDLVVVRDELDRMLGKYGGYVADEETVNDSKGRTEYSTLTLRVPAERFDEAMGEFDEFGKVTDTKRKTDDVTTEVIDVEARIRTQQVSLQRLRGFLSQAATVDAMIRLESEIARREADLASLQAQQRYLDDQTSLSTIVLTLHGPDDAPPPKDDEDPLEDAGFFTGLQNGWNALLDILLVVATVIGAVIPFAVVLAVFGLPAYLWLRRHRPVAPPAPDAG